MDYHYEMSLTEDHEDFCQHIGMDEAIQIDKRYYCRNASEEGIVTAETEVIKEAILKYGET